MNPIELALRNLEGRPEVAGNPLAREWLQVIRNGDAKRGEEIARNLCRNNGVTVEQALEDARKKLGL